MCRYVCVCGPGYSGNGRFCEDIDECGEVTSLSSGPCSGNSDCHNTVGGYRCPCKPGLQADGDRCKRKSTSYSDLNTLYIFFFVIKSEYFN